MHITTYNLHKTTKWCIMNNENIRKIYTENINANVILAFKQRNADVTRVTVRQKGQMKNQRFYLIKKGVAEFKLNNGKIITATNGDILYFPPDVTYKSTWLTNTDNETYAIHFSILFSDTDLTLSDNIFKVTNDKNLTICSLFSDIYELSVNNSVGNNIKIKANFYEILHLLTPSLYGKIENTYKNPIYFAINYIESNLYSEINVDYLSKLVNMCNSAFRQKFKQVTGVSPIKYKNNILIKKAKTLLSSGEFTVSEVASQLNFNDIYYFSRLFKQITGISPIDFKNK